ncbi:MAG: radical SAM protein [Desulfosarcinaceae bacterium]|nr:radical SAM protein [Desulfosarcinaceae bacterium]
MADATPTIQKLRHRLQQAGLALPRTVTFAITNRCNLRCAHCWPQSGPLDNAPEVPAADALALIDTMVALGASHITLTGGEPLTHPEWWTLLRHACSHPGVAEVRLQTNAILLDPATVAKFATLATCRLVLQISLEGADAVHHDRVRGEGSFDQTMAGIHLLLAGGLAAHICITFTEMAHNFDAIPQLLSLVDRMGIEQFVTGTLVPGGRAAASVGMAPPTAEQTEQLVSRYQTDAGFKARYDRIGNIAALEWLRAPADSAESCCRLIETPYVTADGRLYPCVMLHASESAANGLFERGVTAAVTDTIDAWARLQQVQRDRRHRIDACRRCRLNATCRAGCMGRAFAAYGDFYAVEDRCQTRLGVYSRRADGG